MEEQSNATEALQSESTKCQSETQQTQGVPATSFQLLSLNELTRLKRNVKKNKKITVDLTGTKYELFRTVVPEFGWQVLEEGDKFKSDEWNLQWYDFYINEDDLRKMLPYQRINHFPGSSILGKKNNLSKHIEKMRKVYPKEYDFYPRTFMLPYQMEELRSYAERRHEKEGVKPVFIAKPEASCQGKGIFLVKKIDQLCNETHSIVQEYLKNPLLIDNLKFDCRIYVLVKSVNPLKIFMYREGLARFATSRYEKPKKSNLSNLMMHLTNYAVNKRSKEFQYNQNEDVDAVSGHKRSLSAILAYIAKTHSPERVNELVLDIQQVINKTICAVQPYLAHLYRSCQPREENSEMCFEIFG